MEHDYGTTYEERAQNAENRVASLETQLAHAKRLIKETVETYDSDDNGRTLRWMVDDLRAFLRPADSAPAVTPTCPECGGEKFNNAPDLAQCKSCGYVVPRDSAPAVEPPLEVCPHGVIGKVFCHVCRTAGSTPAVPAHCPDHRELDPDCLECQDLIIARAANRSPAVVIHDCRTCNCDRCIAIRKADSASHTMQATQGNAKRIKKDATGNATTGRKKNHG